MEKVFSLANLYVATLRQIYEIHLFAHWQSKGPEFYANHLVFERLYKSAQENADLAAEKMIGLFGCEGVDYKIQADFMNKIALKYADLSDNPTEMALKIEKDFLKYSKEVYSAFEDEGVLSQGLDDMVLSIASSREEACYLLQQILEN